MTAVRAGAHGEIPRRQGDMKDTDPTPYVIGLTGLPSTGKGEAAAALIACARRRGWRAACLSFSDQIKDEAKARGIPEKTFTRELLSQIGTELRQNEGPGALAARIVRKIQAWPPPPPEVFVADGVRHPGEARALRDAFGRRFTLVAVESEPREIVGRLMARRRPDESPEALQSQERTVRLLERELHGEGPAQAPNVGECMRIADARIPNHGTLEELRSAVAAFLLSGLKA